jgi:diguanylate cyclase (GGDEF)-like protein
MNGPLAKTTPSRAASLSLIPVFVLVLSVIGSMAIVAQRAAARQEVLELEREKRQLSQSLTYDSDQLLQQIARDEALGELFQAQRERERAERMIGALLRRYGGDYGALLSRSDGQIIADKGDLETRIPRADFVLKLVDSSRMRSMEGAMLGIGRESRLLHDGLQALQLATLPVGRNLILVVTRPVNGPMLRRLASVLALPDLRLMSGEPETEALYPIQGLGAEAMSFVWTPSRTASETMADLSIYGAIAAFFVAVVAAMLFRSIRVETATILKREAKANFDARHDGLSGLPNRAVFCDMLEHVMKTLDDSHKQVAVLLLDLDKFKDVNDTYGHAAGDKVIIDFGQRVRALLRQTDTIARLGGDEFAVLLPDSRGQNEVGRLAQAIIDATLEPFTKDGAALRIGVSVGVAFAPDDGCDMATVLRAADTALYRAKNEGRNRFAFYEHRMTEAERMRKLVDDELRGAIEKNELTLVYQPQINAETGKLAAVEALVRWRHPQHGMISPALFVAAAEERNLIVPLGDWVLRRACQDAARWNNMRVGVNVSAIQFRQPKFVEHVTSIAQQAGLEPCNLELELTEGVLVEHADQAEEAMMNLREAGFRLALDDFGTGYSSMIYLRRFAFDKIKIDKSFLDSLEESGESAILVHSVVHLGRALGLEVTAEGVETEEQHRFLKAVGCHYLQGYLFSKPVTAEAIDAMLLSEREGAAQTARKPAA